METEKGRLRKHVRECKKQYSPDELAAMSRRVTEPLTHYIIKKDGFSTILLYHSLPDEVCTHELIRDLLAAGKRIVLPTVAGDELELHLLTQESLTHTGYQGIMESDGPLIDDYKSIDLAIIPGMAFTKRGDRLGRGKGYYDRLLPKLTCPTLGLAFPFQIVPTLPCEPHDKKIDYVVS